MGIFGGGYLKEGPGVSKDGPEKNRFFLFFELFFRKFSKLMLLNFIYFVTLIPLLLGVYLSVQVNPVITDAIANGVLDNNALNVPWFVFTGDIVGLALVVVSIFITGPATAGFTYVLRNFQRQEHAWVFSDFKEHFRKNYKQGVLMGLVDVIASVLLYVALVFYVYMMPLQMPDMQILSTIGATLIVIVSIAFIIMHFYIYVMMVTFKLTFKQLIRNALLFTFARLPVNVLIFIVDAAIVLACILFPIALYVLTPLLLFSLLGFFTVYAVYPSIDRFMISKVDGSGDSTPEEDEDARDFTDTV